MTLKQRYLTYRAVQVTSILLGIIVITLWPDFHEESVWEALKTLIATWDAQPLGHILATLLTALNTPVFWAALGLYILAFSISVAAYARIMAVSPVMVGQMLALTVALCLLGALTSLNWFTALTLLAPLLIIMMASGILYNAILSALRIRRERTGFYTRKRN